MAYFHTCSLCGAHLDPGERCDCEEQKKPPTEVAIPQTAGNQRMANYNTHIIQEGWWSVNAVGTHGLRDPLRDVQQDAPLCECEMCRGEMWSGEKRFHWTGKRICVDCFKEEVTDWLNKAPIEVAYALNLDVEEVE